MSTDVLRRTLSRELEYLHALQSRNLPPISCVLTRLEGEPPDRDYRPQFSPLPYHEDWPIETVMTDAAFHPSLGVTHPYVYTSHFGHGTVYVTVFTSVPRPFDPFEALNRPILGAIPATELHDPASEAIRIARQVCERLSPLVRSLPVQLAERLGFVQTIPPSDWVANLFHFGWHFPSYGIDAMRGRILAGSGEVPWDFRCAEGELQLGGVRAAPDRFPGVIVSRLGDGSDVLAASVSALRLILEALDGIERVAQPQPNAEFARLRDTFLRLAAASSLHPRQLGARVLRLADSFRTPPATVWAGIERGGDGWGIPRYYVLSHLDANRVVCELRGPDLETFRELANRAGSLLPAWPAQRYPALLADVGAFARYCDPAQFSRAGLAGDMWNRGMVTDHRGNEDRWLGVVFGCLMANRLEHLHLTTRPDDAAREFGAEPVNAMLTLRDMNLFAASARAIELAGLIPPSPPVSPPPVQTPTSAAPQPTPEGTTPQAQPHSPIPTPRLRFDDTDRSVYLDGNRLIGEVELALFRFFRAIAEAYPNSIAFKEIQRRTTGLLGKHPTRDLKDRLPAELARLVESGKHGYRLTLPAPK